MKKFLILCSFFVVFSCADMFQDKITFIDEKLISLEDFKKNKSAEEKLVAPKEFFVDKAESQTKIRLRWSSVSAADKYEIYRATMPAKGGVANEPSEEDYVLIYETSAENGTAWTDNLVSGTTTSDDKKTFLNSIFIIKLLQFGLLRAKKNYQKLKLDIFLHQFQASKPMQECFLTKFGLHGLHLLVH